MLTITIPKGEYYNESTQEFIYSKEQVLHLEHSLISLSKWESKWKVPFLGPKQKTNEQVLDYVKCMTLDRNVDDEVYTRLTNVNIDEIVKYIDDPMTATTFRDNKRAKKSNEIVTSELIYYWIIALNIPMECQKWHLNRLLTLVRVCDIKNDPKPKKMPLNEVYSSNSALNKARREAMKSRG